MAGIFPNLQCVAEKILHTGREKGAAMVSTLGKNSEFAEVNIYNEGSLLMALRGEITPHWLDVSSIVPHQ